MQHVLILHSAGGPIHACFVSSDKSEVFEKALNLQSVISYVDWLERMERYESELGFNYWPFTLDGQPVLNPHADDVLLCCTCTHSALLIAQQFGGRVMGYPDGGNLGARCGNGDEHHNQGHDFAVLGDYIVDYWAWSCQQQIIFPILHLEHDAVQIRRLYGPSRRWILTRDFTRKAA